MIGGYGSNGSAGPASAFLNLPAKYKNLDGWFEDLMNAMSLDWDILNAEFISATARANLLDPTVTPSRDASAILATSTEAPTDAATAATVLDLMLSAVGAEYPVSSNLTVEEKQALVYAMAAALQRKGTRISTGDVVAQVAGEAVHAATSSLLHGSVVIPDGYPSPGWGDWVPAGTSDPSQKRPWLFETVRALLKRIYPACSEFGVGYSQFRAGYSGAGEPVFTSGAQLSLTTNGNFATWTGGAGTNPDSWTPSAYTAGTCDKLTAQTGTNWEFTDYAAQLNLTGVAAGSGRELLQTITIRDANIEHSIEVDYEYSNAQDASVLQLSVLMPAENGSVRLRQDGEWDANQINLPVVLLPPGDGRQKFRITFTIPTVGTVVTSAEFPSSKVIVSPNSNKITLSLRVISDGTPTTQDTFQVYAFQVYELWSKTRQLAAQGERTLWAPFSGGTQGNVDYTFTLSNGALFLPINAERDRVLEMKVGSGLVAYHPALSGFGLLSVDPFGWTNRVDDGYTLASWTLSSCTASTNAEVSPIYEEELAGTTTATRFTASANGAYVQTTSSSAGGSAVRWMAGVWVKKLSPDTDFTDVTLSFFGVSKSSTTYTVRQADGWRLLSIPTISDTNATQTFRISWGAAFASGHVAIWGPHVYELGVATLTAQYPPVVIRSGGGADGVISNTTYRMLTSTTGTDVYDPQMKFRMVTVTRGALYMRIVPTFTPVAGLDGCIFVAGQSDTVNKIQVDIAGTTLYLRHYDGSANYSASVSIAGWQRDTAYEIRATWNASTGLSLTAGGVSGTASPPGGFAPSEASVSRIRLGCNWAGTAQYNCLIADLEVTQIGEPIA